MKCSNVKCMNNVSRRSLKGLCRHCLLSMRHKKYRKKLQKKEICIDCHQKVNPIITYPNGLDGIKIVKNPIRCYNCRLKANSKYVTK